MFGVPKTGKSEENSFFSLAESSGVLGLPKTGKLPQAGGAEDGEGENEGEGEDKEDEGEGENEGEEKDETSLRVHWGKWLNACSWLSWSLAPLVEKVLQLVPLVAKEKEKEI